MTTATAADLDFLDHFAAIPHRERLSALIRELTRDEGLERLSEELGYTNPGAMRTWLRMNRVPVRHLPTIATYLGVGLGLVASLWLTQEASDTDAEALFQATKPRITGNELAIVETARKAFADDLDDSADDRLARYIRGV